MGLEKSLLGCSAMKNIALSIMGGVAALTFAPSAQAATSITFTPGVGGLTAGQTLLAGFTNLADSAGVSGSGFDIHVGSDGNGADPAVGGTGDPYLSVLGGGTANFTFGGLTQLGFDYGSADLYNQLLLIFSNGPNESYNGSALINGGIANGDQIAPATNGRITITADGGRSIVGMQLTSSANSFEIDNLGTIRAVPEPATWAMMLIGFGGIGYAMRRRPSPKVSAYTA
jgi:hypothetical protein